jgi:hydroxymethylpyrimidine/phosphomethylpyrimidine kinase
LTIAGSDSGGGAGIQADLKTFSAYRVFGMSVITAVTAQNSVGVQAVECLSPAFVARQIESVLEDFGADAAKCGMLANAAIIDAVATSLASRRVEKLVVDPVMVAKSGASLLEPEAVRALTTRLLPLALAVTPNLPEAEVLAGMPVANRAEMEEAARRIHALGPRHVLVKGGHLKGDAVDLSTTAGSSRPSRLRVSTPTTPTAPAARSPRPSRPGWPRAAARGGGARRQGLCHARHPRGVRPRTRGGAAPALPGGVVMADEQTTAPDPDTDRALGKMSFMEHLGELRTRIMWSVASAGVGIIIAFSSPIRPCASSRDPSSA